MLRIVSLLASILLTVCIAIGIAGYLISPKYVHTEYFQSTYSAQVTWQELIAINNIPKQKNDVTSVEVVGQYGKLLAWKENLKNGGYRIYRMNERIENQKLVLELTNSTNGLSGIWTFTLEPNTSGTFVAIDADTTLDNLPLRGYRFFFGRNHEELVWIKFLNVGLTNHLINTL